MKNRIAFITIYFGKEPKYTDLFLYSASYNTEYDFIIFSNWKDIKIKSDNIFYYYLDLPTFNNLALAKGILKKPILRPYKLCDLKPAWFHILEDFEQLSQYEYIGYIDLDIILGNMNSFINIDKLACYDIWTVTPDFLCGALTIFNISEGKKNIYLYKKSEYWEYIFNEERNFAFDEDLLWDIKGDFKKHEIVSFTDIVKHELNNGLRVKWNQNFYYNNNLRKFKWEKGLLHDQDGKEYLAYDLVYAKHYWLWYFPKWKTIPRSFIINKFGITKLKNIPLNRFTLLLIPPFCFNTFKQIIRHLIS